jgi:aminoglycoside 3-N-acetyltransferase
MPTHTYFYPSTDGKIACFDPIKSGSVVGAISDYFWRQPGVIRSLHPTHSLACEGSLATSLCRDHEWSETPCGAGTPYEQLVRIGSAVLMFGVTLDSYTLFHTAEDAAEVSYLYMRKKTVIAYRGPLGIRWHMLSYRHDMTVPRRFAEMENWLQERDLLVRRKLGMGELLYIPDAARLHDALVIELKNDPWLLVQSGARPKPLHCR